MAEDAKAVVKDAPDLSAIARLFALLEESVRHRLSSSKPVNHRRSNGDHSNSSKLRLQSKLRKDKSAKAVAAVDTRHHLGETIVKGGSATIAGINIRRHHHRDNNSSASDAEMTTTANSRRPTALVGRFARAETRSSDIIGTTIEIDVK